MYATCLRLCKMCCSHQIVTMDNAEEYVESMFDFCMHTGIQKQMEAFRGKTLHDVASSYIKLMIVEFLVSLFTLRFG